MIVNARDAGVEFLTGTEATPELVASLKADAAIIATGSRAAAPAHTRA